MSNISQPPGAIVRALLSAFLLLACTGYAVRPSPFAEGELAEAEQQDLRMGYELLSDLLADTSRGKPCALTPALVGTPSHGVAELMNRLCAVSRKRAQELSQLLRPAPTDAARPAGDDANRATLFVLASDLGRPDMLRRDADSDARFLATRARAIRMIAAMAKATARFEPSQVRRTWLDSLALEYEGFLGELGRHLDRQTAAR